jgi:hypothetical protein
MEILTINIGSQLDDPSADIERTAWGKVNTNFTEVESQLTNIDNYEKVVNMDMTVWDMDADGTKTLAYTFPANKRMVSINCTIQNDAKTVYTDLAYGGTISYSKANSRFDMTRNEGCIFDGTDYNDATILRGSVRFVIVPDVAV